MKKNFVNKNVLKYIKKNSLNFSIIGVALILAVSTGGHEFILSDRGILREAYTTTPVVSAEQAIVIDAETGDILYEKNADEKAYPASTTKIMTAIVTIEVLEKLKSPIEQWVTVPAICVGTEGSSIYLAYDERVRLEDLLYGMMLRSGNDASVAIAEIIGGDVQENNDIANSNESKKTNKQLQSGVDRFVIMMNQKAMDLGCSSTNYVNPNGLFDKNHYTTVRDMAAISLYAMKNETFKKIVGTKEYQGHRATDKYNYFVNKNKVVYQYQGGNGIKIGYTKASGRTLVASAKRENRQLICVVMSAPDWFNDAYNLMDYCFENK